MSSLQEQRIGRRELGERLEQGVLSETKDGSDSRVEKAAGIAVGTASLAIALTGVYFVGHLLL